ncbi:hypothetical protein [Marilutibacter aestuarii]|uniref:hypothetical protein n=1 Tax=Marilutibacter aestuarii TaxID=1706195 RepID=UPI001476BBB4|nr:hypothetical protein [Lysobacter aestuarii]
MNDVQGYAVFFFPKAIEALGGAIEPYLLGEKGGEHVLCREVDTGGAFTKMVLDGRTPQGAAVELELMIPGSMVRMIVSARSEEAFGFGPRVQTALPAQAIVADAPVPAAQPSAKKKQVKKPARKAATPAATGGKAAKKTAKKAAKKPAGKKSPR